MTALAIVDNHTPEWHAQRLTGLGGSDAAAIAGFDDYKSPLAVYYEKIGQLPDKGAGEAAHWGNLLEGPVAEEFGRRTGLTVVKAPEFVRHEEHDFLFANCDRLIVEETDAILEVKTTGAFMAANWDDGVPPRVEIQVQHYLEVMGKTRAYVCVLIGGQRFAYFTIERDDRTIAALLKIEAAFWERVCTKNAPTADGAASTKAALGAVWGDTTAGKAVVLPTEAASWISGYWDAHVEMKAAEERKETYGNLLRQALEDAEEGWLDGKTVCTLKTVPEGEVAAYTRKAYRRLNPKKVA